MPALFDATRLVTELLIQPLRERCAPDRQVCTRCGAELVDEARCLLCGHHTDPDEPAPINYAPRWRAFLSLPDDC